MSWLHAPYSHILKSDHSTAVIIANCNLNKAARLLNAVDKDQTNEDPAKEKAARRSWSSFRK